MEACTRGPQHGASVACLLTQWLKTPRTSVPANQAKLPDLYGLTSEITAGHFCHIAPMEAITNPPKLKEREGDMDSTSRWEKRQRIWGSVIKPSQ